MTERRYGATAEKTYVRDAFEGYTLDELFEDFCEDGDSLVYQLASHVRELEARVEALRKEVKAASDKMLNFKHAVSAWHCLDDALVADNRAAASNDPTNRRTR